MIRNHAPPTTTRPWRGLLLLGAAILLIGCGGEETLAEASPLGHLRVVGVDFQLNSILLTNEGTDVVRTENLYLCQDDQCFQFGIFSIEPRATIIFDVEDAGGVVPSGGEIALFASGDFTEPGSMLDYVAWGSPGHAAVATAAEARLWSEQDFVATDPATIILTRIDPGAPGSDAWEASDEIS